ncbi:hypothetical protein HID58_075355 [Brassica napus]|uniref:Uncharacterized protein n=1 Tax=Brassica napus TaxID=3708 RepID=A0ABQ7YM29_BRANA|nr:hypothetical protein HID58_075355 [Brassica napus]
MYFTLIGYYCLKWIFGYYCINPSCILQSERVNGTNAGRKSLAEDKGPDVPAVMLVPRKIKLQNRALFYWTKINPLAI